jgi:hypothetical protein
MRLRSGLLCFVPGPAGDRGGSLWKASDVSRDHVPYCAANVNAADKDTPGVGRARYSNRCRAGFWCYMACDSAFLRSGEPAKATARTREGAPTAWLPQPHTRFTHKSRTQPTRTMCGKLAISHDTTRNIRKKLAFLS